MKLAADWRYRLTIYLLGVVMGAGIGIQIGMMIERAILAHS